MLVGLILLLIKLFQQNGRLLAENRRFESEMHHRVQGLLQEWQDRELDKIRLNERDLASRDAATQLQQWKLDVEISIRNDAIQKSQSATIGKVTEHLAPYLPAFAFNPKDVRFIGSPIDLIIFDGLDEDELREIVFVEVKTGRSASLTTRERRVRDAIIDKRVKWLKLQIDRAD